MIRELSIQLLDEGKATLRLITILAWNQLPIPRLDYIAQSKKEKIGATAFYSSLKVLKNLGLVEEIKDETKRRRVTLTALTEKGGKIAEKIIEIQRILRE
jgi:hypothetical protein